MRQRSSGETRWWETLARTGSARAESAFARAPRNTLSGSKANQNVRDMFSARSSKRVQKTRKTSGWAAIYGLRASSIRKKIIGHGMRPIPPGFGRGERVGHPRGAFALLHQPSRQHGGCIFLHPLIQQSANFLAEIGSMSQTRQFKTLQGVSGSGKKELPGRLRRARGHTTSE